MLPDSYSTPLHLPFNRTLLEREFSFLPPDADPGGPGVFVLLQGDSLVLETAPGILSLPEGEASLPAGETPDLFMGLWQGRPCRLRKLDRYSPLPGTLLARSLSAGEPQLPIELLSLGGMAMQLSHWEKSSHVCSRCGGGMLRVAGEWGKRCQKCSAAHFPHIHPCVIVIVQRPGEVLLTRKPQWAPNRYSLVAGFVDVGECLEEAVAREVREETGVEINNVRYVGSQAWPFPSQLMIGYRADYVSGEVVVEEKELADARWFSLDALPDLPPHRSIARYLLDTCLGR